MSAGGSIQEVTLSGRRFAVAAEAESNRKLGGFENEAQANGDGSVRIVKKRVPFKLDGLQLDIDDNRLDQEYLQELANRTEMFPITVSYVNGTTYAGVAQITSELQGASMSTTATITLEGQAELVIQ
jgi:hypothetical protein